MGAETRARVVASMGARILTFVFIASMRILFKRPAKKWRQIWNRRGRPRLGASYSNWGVCFCVLCLLVGGLVSQGPLGVEKDVGNASKCQGCGQEQGQSRKHTRAAGPCRHGAEQSRSEQNNESRTEQNRAEQIRKEQNRAEHNRTGESRSEQNDTEQNRREQCRARLLCPALLCSVRLCSALPSSALF